MKIFASIFGQAELGALDVLPAEGVYGVTVFVRRFIRALLRYGDFDELHFFVAGLYQELRDGDLLASDPRIRRLRLYEFTEAAQQESYHVLHNMWSPDIGPWTDLRNRMSGRNIPVTGLTHTISYHSFLPRVLGTMLLGMRPWDSIVCTTDSARRVMRNWEEHLSREFGGQIGVDLQFTGRLDRIPLAVDPDIFCPGEKAALRRRLELPPDDVLSLYVGRFSHYDKMDLFPLLMAFKAAIDRAPSPRATLILAGGESSFEYGRRVETFAGELGIAGQVVLRKNVPEADLSSLYAACDLFVSPSDNLQETFGQSILEAMASGLPVVCSDWDGYKELVVDQQTGLRVSTYWVDGCGATADFASLSDWLFDHFYLAQTVSVDVPELSRAIELLICDEGLRRKLGTAGRQRVLDLFTWPVVIRQYLEMWNELSTIAAAAPATSRQTSWYRPDFVRTFSHYPTALVGPKARVICSARREAQPYTEMAPYLHSDVLRFMRERAASEIAVGELEAQATDKLQITSDAFRVHLLWLLKYDLLAIDRGHYRDPVKLPSAE